MRTMSITEALAEVKLINKKITNNRDEMMRYLYRPENQKDPLEKDGGSQKFVAARKQAISNLAENLLKIRRSIAKANEQTQVTINTGEGKSSHTKTIAEWLTWRKEVAPSLQQLNVAIRQQLNSVRLNLRGKDGKLIEDPNQSSSGDVIVNISEASILKENNELDEILQRLDGQLSLKNATVMIEVDD